MTSRLEAAPGAADTGPVKAILTAVLIGAALAAGAAEPELISVRKIWDSGGHNAFTDLIRFQDRWFCSFREAAAHVGGDGKVRIIESSDGEAWETAAVLAETGIDLRDPKLSITPAGRLMVVAGGSVYNGTKKLQGRQPRVAFSADGHDWSPPRRVLAEGDWLWRVTWYKGQAYGVSYHAAIQANPERALQLYRSTDGLDWKPVAALDISGFPNETTLRFLRSGEAVMLVRREQEDQGGWIGSSRAPYTNWSFQSTTVRVGGPNFIELPNGSLVAGSRDHSQGKVKLSLFRMTRGNLTPVLTLPSGGDCSYPGLVWHDGMLWVSYYSSHERKTSIYLAKVKWPVD